MKDVTIGILAGMGPRSTSPFLEAVLDECQRQYGAMYDLDYPHIVIYSLPTPFYVDRETDEEALKRSIKVGLDRLENMGVDLIAIPCNSAHGDFEFITEDVKVPVLNIIEETLKGLEKGLKASLFATDITRKSELYQNGMKQHGCEFVFDEEWQSILNQVIQRIKNKEDIITTEKIWIELLERVKREAVDTVVLACTDLNIVANRTDGHMKFIDSSAELAKSLVSKYLELKGMSQNA